MSTQDALISLTVARRIIKQRLRLRRAPDLATVWRWRKQGLIESRRVGGRVYFTAEAIERFLAGDGQGPVVAKRSPRPAQTRRMTASERRLARAGI